MDTIVRPHLTSLPGIIVPKNTTIAILMVNGEYGHLTEDAKKLITDQHFKVADLGARLLFLAHFNEDVTTEHVEAVAKEMGYELASASDSLSVGAHPEHRKLQLQFPIVALGSPAVISKCRRVLILGKWNSKRRAYVGCSDIEWRACCRFLFVGKDNPSDT